MKQIVVSILLLFLMLYSCNKPHDSNIDKRVIDMGQIVSLSLPDVGNNIRLLPLEEHHDWIIGRYTKAIEYDSKLFMLDPNQKVIFIYNCDTGQFVGMLNCFGQGPGEYLHIADFTINPYKNHIEFVDGVNLWEYDFDSNFIGMKKITNEVISAVNKIEIVDENTIAFISFFDDDGARLYARDKGKFVRGQNIVPAWTRTKIPFQTLNPFYRYGNVINYFEGFSNKVYSITADGYQCKYEWDFGQYNFEYDKPPLIDDFRKAESFMDILKNREYYCNKYIQTFQHNIENTDYIVTCFLFMNEPATLIFSKKHKSYIVVEGDLSKLFMFSKIEFTGKNEMLVLSDLVLLKRMPLEWFSAAEQDFIIESDINSNPFIVRFELNENLFVK